jgi:predicted nucleotidyltransferase
MKRKSATVVELALTPQHLALVRGLLRKHAPRHRAFAFGSRVIADSAARARLKPHSDLDLALEGPQLQPQQSFALREAFSESDLPMRVDIVEAADLPVTWNIRAWPL